MSSAVQVLTVIVLLILIPLIGYLIFAIMRMRQLIEEVRVQVQDNVSPLLKESTELVSNINKVSAGAANVTGAASRIAGMLEEKVEHEKSEGGGRSLGFRIAREIVTRLAGASKAAKSLRKKEGASEPPGEEEGESNSN